LEGVPNLYMHVDNFDGRHKAVRAALELGRHPTAPATAKYTPTAGDLGREQCANVVGAPLHLFLDVAHVLDFCQQPF